MSLASDVIKAGLHSAIPAAASTNNGVLYYETDTEKLFRSNGSAWVQVSAAANLVAASTTGWVTDANTWSYSSADSPTFVISVNADMTTVLSVGMRIKLTQTTDKYFIVTAVGAFGGGVTLVTVYGGTDYTLANAAITNPYYSTSKAPLGFPLDPTKWTVRVTDATSRSQASPVNGTWYNLGSNTISIPIGAWLVRYQCAPAVAKAAATDFEIYATLSTANNTESDNEMTSRFYHQGSTGETAYAETTFNRSKTLVVASKTSYYLNCKTASSMTTLYLNSYTDNMSPMILEAICAYL